MPRTIIFHVGLPKTGTSTIQNYLRTHEERLRALGFLYPGPRDHERLHNEKHLVMLSAITGKENPLTQGLDARACRTLVGRVCKSFRRSDLEGLIWSCEGMALGAPKWRQNYLERLVGRDRVRIVFFARYTSDWVEFAIRQNIWGRVPTLSRPKGTIATPLPPLAPSSGPAGDAEDASLLGRGGKVIECLRTMRTILPSADIVVRSYDADREQGRVVSGALEAMGVPIDGAFRDADAEAGVRNPTKSSLYSMLLYNLLSARADGAVIREVGDALEEAGATRRGLSTAGKSSFSLSLGGTGDRCARLL